MKAQGNTMKIVIVEDQTTRQLGRGDEDTDSAEANLWYIFQSQ